MFRMLNSKSITNNSYEPPLAVKFAKSEEYLKNCKWFGYTEPVNRCLRLNRRTFSQQNEKKREVISIYRLCFSSIPRAPFSLVDTFLKKTFRTQSTDSEFDGRKKKTHRTYGGASSHIRWHTVSLAVVPVVRLVCSNKMK